MSILWVLAGRQIANFADQFKTTQLLTKPIHEIGYYGNGDGGTLVLDGVMLNLSPLNPHIGTTKDNEVAVAYSGKVFPLGPLGAADEGKFAASVPQNDTTSFETRASYISWPSLNRSGLYLHRNSYYYLFWQKSDGLKLQMTWVVHYSNRATGLIRVEISDAAR